MNEESKQRVEPLSCADPDLSSLVIFYMNGDVSMEERKKLEDHLTQCKPCVEELKLFTLVQNVMETDMFEKGSAH